MDWRKYIIITLIIASANIGFGALGLHIVLVREIITWIWPPAGIALAAMLFFGYRIWPAVALGAFLVNFLFTHHPLAAGLISFGNTLEAVFATYLLKRVAGFHTSLQRRQDVIALVFLGALLSTTLGASFGVAATRLAGLLSDSEMGTAWLIWWLADMVADLTFAPMVLIWGSRTHYKLEWKNFPLPWVEFGLLIFSSTQICGLKDLQLRRPHCRQIPKRFSPRKRRIKLATQAL